MRSARPTELHIVHPTDGPIPAEFQDRWREFSMGAPPLEPLPGLLRERNIVVTDVPVLLDQGRPVGADGRPLIPTRTVALVFVSAVNDATIRAVNFAETLEASETRAIYFDLDPEAAHRMQEEWGETGMRIPLDIVEAPFRDLTGPMLEEVRRFSSRPGTLALVVVPEFIVSKWRHLLLHNQNALFVKRLFLFEPNVVLSSVPFALGAAAKEVVAR
jgi:hypothetical protein